MEPKMRKGGGIAERLMDFSVGVGKLMETLPRGPAARHVGMQLFRSATGGASNYEEARAAESREDFVHKIAIAAKEIRESAYWLEYLQRSGWLPASGQPLVREAAELSAILAASCRTARTKSSH